jgi:Recombination directionality factor-like
MPINGVLDLQRRSLPLGQIRIGESEEIPGKKGRRPVRRETFRFTTPVEETAHAISARLGGTPAPWDRRPGYWVVDTDRLLSAGMDVWVPPRGLAVDAWMEMWDGGRCLRRCDGLTETRSGQPCMCPQPQDRTDPAAVARAANERKRLAGLKPPQGCKPLTRINLAIPWLPGAIGVWRLNTGSANAAVETADTGEVLARARDMDVFLPALLLAHLRPGQDGHPYPVVALQLRPSAEQLAQLPAGMDGMLAQIGGGNSNGFRAITSGKPGPQVPSAQPSQPAQAKRHQVPPKAVRTAQDIADHAWRATTKEEITALSNEAKSLNLADEDVCSSGDAEHEVHEPLSAFMNSRWSDLPHAPRRAGR